MIKIDPLQSWGIWEGWGTSLAWWAHVFGDRDDLADLLFTEKFVAVNGQTLPGLAMNIARYNVGACSTRTFDGRQMVVSKNIIASRQIEGFWLDPKNPDPTSESWDWSRDVLQRAMLQKARDRGADQLELFSNSPMWWMTANDNPSGGVKPNDENLPPQNYQIFAVYLATVARHARDEWGITFNAVEPFNEPASGYWNADGKQEGCAFYPPAQAAFLPILRAELDRQGLTDLPITASDETFYDHALATWQNFDSKIKALIMRVNVHGYQNSKGRRSELYQTVHVEDGKPLWNTEHGEGDPSGLDLARNFHHDMAELHPTAWCYWQPLDGSNWGILEADLSTREISPASAKLFVFAQYSRHIRPGMTILKSSNPNTVAASSAKDGKLVLVTFNNGPARSITYDLSACALSEGSPIERILTEPKGIARYEKLSDLKVHGKQLEVRFPADSIQTLEIPLRPR